MRKFIAIFLAAMMLFSTMALSAEENGFRTLDIGDNGADVLLLKQALAALGYMKTANFSAEYTKETAKRVRQFQEEAGLTPTGTADAETQRMLCELSGCTPVPTQTPKPTPVPVPTATPAPPTDENGYPLDMPARDEKGFLADPDAGEYWFCNEDAGFWLYASPVLAIEIRRYEEPEIKNIWFECDIQACAESPLLSKINWSKNGRVTVGRTPEQCAQENRYVLCLSDDHFGARLHASSRLGVCIRDGKIITDECFSRATSHFPNLDVLALFADGSMLAYLNGEHTAAEYLEMGAVDTFCFGPMLVSGGEVNPLTSDRDYHYVQEPRCALGMIEPYHYFALVVNGRVVNSDGVRLDWLANKMLEKGVVEAINLDGGGTASLVFMGQRLNRTGSGVRSLYSCIGFGQTDACLEPQ